MSDLFFLAKMIFATICLVLFLQIKIGDHTLEDRAMVGIKASPMSEWVQEVGAGGWKVLARGISSGVEYVKGWVKSSDSPGQRHNKFSIERSKEFLKEQADQLEKKARAQIQSEDIEVAED